VLSMIFWSFSFIWFKVANRVFEPITIVFFRLLIAVSILSLYLWFTKSYVKIRKEDRKLFIILALFEPFFYFLGESYGLTHVSATAGSVLISTIPVVASLAAWIIFKERLRFINYAGIIISFAGVLIFIVNKDGSLSFTMRGLILMGIAVMSAVGYNLTLSRLVGGYSPAYIVNVQNILGAILFLPLFLIVDLQKLNGAQLQFSNFIPVIELSIFASCGAFILFAYSVKRIGISKANVFTNSIPVFTATFSFLILNDKLTLKMVAGMAVVITGLFLSQINGKRKARDEEAMALTGKTA
jgi:drug/metabolite transporter (DMT)-like permease